MSSTVRRRRVGLVVASLVASMLALAALATAAVIHPTLRSPRNGQRIHAGVIRLIVQDRGVPRHFSVYVAISPRSKLLKADGLPVCAPAQVKHGCDFLKLTRRAHHPGEWIYTSRYSFPGYWAVTPGMYHWQAEHVSAAGTDVTSRTRSFRVTP
jgi:hypothetical protein